MTRIAFTADSQVDEHSRLEEHDRVMDSVVRDAASRHCDVLLHAGDVYERRSTARERAAVRRWVWHPEGPDFVVMAGGNHESPGEVEELHDGKYAFAYERPHVLSRIVGVLVAVLPWPRREWLRSYLPADTSRDEIDAAMVEALRDILRGFRVRMDELDPDGELPRILLAHLDVTGSKTGPDQPDVPRGLMLGSDDLGLAGADVVALGHIHYPQEIDVPGAQWAGYAGSPVRTAYSKGEAAPKSYVVFEFDGRRLVSAERVPTPATPMLLIEDEFDGTLGGEMPEHVAGAEIRYRYAVNADEREEAARAAEEIRAYLLSRGAAAVKLDPVVRPVTRARAPEVAAAVGVGNKLVAYWDATGQVEDEDRRARLLGMVREIEEVDRVA